MNCLCQICSKLAANLQQTCRKLSANWLVYQRTLELFFQTLPVVAFFWLTSFILPEVYKTPNYVYSFFASSGKLLANSLKFAWSLPQTFLLFFSVLLISELVKVLPEIRLIKFYTLSTTLRLSIVIELLF